MAYFVTSSFDKNVAVAAIEHFNSVGKEVGEKSYFRSDRAYLVAIESETNTVIGVLCYREEAAWYPDYMGIGYVSVTQDCKNQGVGTALLRQLFSIAKSNGKGIKVGSYEPEGEMYLPSVIKRLAVEFSVATI